MAGNTHNSMVFQSTLLYKRRVAEGIIPEFDFFGEGGVKVTQSYLVILHLNLNRG